MKNKGLSPVITTLIIILLVIIALGIIWVVVNNVIQGGIPTELTIYKEECTTFLKDYNCLSKYDICNIERPSSGGGKCYFDSGSFEEICEQVEVDEIEYKRTEEELMEDYKEDIDWNYLSYVSYKNVCLISNIYFNDFDECMKKYEYLKIKEISKSDLTTEWLSENCECLDECPPRTEMYKGNCHHKSYIKCSEKNFGGCGDSVNLVWNCQEYKCGDYTVEVNR